MLILIGKRNLAMIVNLIRMLVVKNEKRHREIHSLMLVSFQTHQGAYLDDAVVVVVHTVVSNSHIG